MAKVLASPAEMGEFAEHSSASKLAAVLAPRVAKELGLSRVLPREEDKPQPTPQITSQGASAPMQATQPASQYIQRASGSMLSSFLLRKYPRDLPVMTRGNRPCWRSKTTKLKVWPQLSQVAHPPVLETLTSTMPPTFASAASPEMAGRCSGLLTISGRTQRP